MLHATYLQRIRRCRRPRHRRGAASTRRGGAGRRQPPPASTRQRSISYARRDPALAAGRRRRPRPRRARHGVKIGVHEAIGLSPRRRRQPAAAARSARNSFSLGPAASAACGLARGSRPTGGRPSSYRETPRTVHRSPTAHEANPRPPRTRRATQPRSAHPRRRPLTRPPPAHHRTHPHPHTHHPQEPQHTRRPPTRPQHPH